MPPLTGLEIILKAVFYNDFAPSTGSGLGESGIDGVPHKYGRHSEWRRVTGTAYRPWPELVMNSVERRIQVCRFACVRLELPKVATSVTRLSGRRLSGNKTGNSAATDWQHFGWPAWFWLPQASARRF
jgi:hypothetical protein